MGIIISICFQLCPTMGRLMVIVLFISLAVTVAVGGNTRGTAGLYQRCSRNNDCESGCCRMPMERECLPEYEWECRNWFGGHGSKEKGTTGVYEPCALDTDCESGCCLFNEELPKHCLPEFSPLCSRGFWGGRR